MIKNDGFEVELLAHTSNMHSGLFQSFEIASFRLRYPLIIHGEFMTHRMFSRNASSNRAIPIETLMKEVENDPFIPVHWGKNRKGMQATEELEPAKEIWVSGAIFAIAHAEQMAKLGYHKQIANRLMMPYQFINTIVTATEWKNFFNLRISDQAQPEIRLLAEMMKEEFGKSTPINSDIHLPFGTSGLTNLKEICIQNVAKAARISYNRDRMESTLEKDKELYNTLYQSGHYSPFEHVAFAYTKDDIYNIKSYFNNGGCSWIDPWFCRNLKGWKSLRYTLEYVGD